MPFTVSRTSQGMAHMSLVSDLLAALDRIPIWKRLQGVPEEVDSLKRRLADLEEKLGDKWPPDVCKFCGERATRLSDAYPPDDKGIVRQAWRCEKCGQYEYRAQRVK